MTSAELADRIQRTDPASLAAFATGCATRVAPVFRAFARSTNPLVFDKWVEDLWALVDHPSEQRAQELAAEIEKVPEASVDDSERPDFYAMRALSAVAYAAQTLVGEDSVQAALWASEATLSLLRDFDYVLVRSDDTLEAGEAGAQAETLDRLDAGLGVSLESSRASVVVSLLGQITNDLVRAHDWDMSGRSDW
jgi:hypothetical protein